MSSVQSDWLWFQQNKLTLRFQSGSEESGSDSVIPDIVTATDTRDMGITRAATTTTTAVIHLTERPTTVDGRTTTEAKELTGIISTITATKAQV